MNPASPSTLDHLVRAGRYLEALKLLRREFRSPLGISPDLDALLAELLQRTGDTDAASAMAQGVVNTPSTAAAVRSRCHIVLGAVDRDAGRLQQAVGHF